MIGHASRWRWFTAVALSSAVAGCKSDTGPAALSSASSQAALAMAAQFQRLGDSVTAAHGDSDSAIRFYGAAAVLRRAPEFDTITIMVDSVPTSFDAFALAVDDTGGPAVCPMPPMDDDNDAPYECPWGLPRSTRTLFAWEPGHPPHIVQLVATADSGSVDVPSGHGAPPGDAASGNANSPSTLLSAPARLTYFDGMGGTWWGIGGYQQNSVSVGSQPCIAPADSAAAGSADDERLRGHGWGSFRMPTVSCHTATFGFVVDATVGTPPLPWAGQTAASKHTISLVASSVPGAYVTLALPSAGH